jgi:hypothetical protein
MHAPSQVLISGKWKVCQPGKEFGCLGLREVCEVDSANGQAPRLVLLRYKRWPQAGGGELALRLNECPEAGQALALPSVAERVYPVAQKSDKDGQPTKANGCPFYEQDITGLVPLFQAVNEAVQKGHPGLVWVYYYNACAALDQLGKSRGGPEVPLQCPPSLAVAADGRIVPLDAELQIENGAPPNTEARKMFSAWFGNEGATGFARPATASGLHARALRKYFQQILTALQSLQSSAGKSDIPRLQASLREIPPSGELEETGEWIKEVAGRDWGINLDEFGAETVAVEAVEDTPQGMTRTPRKGRKLLLCSLLLNLLLLALLALLWWRGRPSAASAAPLPAAAVVQDEPASAPVPVGDITFSSYCVVFLTQGTIGEKVQSTLDGFFPKRVQVIYRASVVQEKMLADRRKQVIASLKNEPELKKLLDQLAQDKNLMFKGFASGAQDKGLPAIIERGGIFSFPTKSGLRYSSLLQPSGLQRLARIAGMAKDSPARTLLLDLKGAIVEYASLRDALALIGNRPAYLVRVGPNSKAHEALRTKLISRLENPVFVTRPIPELFDAVDPSSDTGGGSAEFRLVLDLPCRFRQVSKKNRSEIDYPANKASLAQLQWKDVKGSEQIKWRPISITYTDGSTAPIASFDIAVKTGNKTVVFRNQNPFIGDSEDQVKTQCERYIKNILRLPTDNLQELVKITETKNQFSGILAYSYLAGVLAEGSTSPVVEVLPWDAFLRQAQTDNQEIAKHLAD